VKELHSDILIVIKTQPFKESDLIVKLISREHGILSGLARGALKSNKRFGGGVLEPFHVIECVWERKKNEANGRSQLVDLREAKLLEDFVNLRKNYELINLGLRILSYYDKLSTEGEDSKSLFYLLGHTLRALTQSQNLEILEVQFLAKFLYDQGVLDLKSEPSFKSYVQQRFNTFPAAPKSLSVDKQKLETQVRMYLGLI